MGRRPSDPLLRNRIRPLRAAAGISQSELARRAGVTRQTVNAVETGRYVPNTAVALRLARALGHPVEEVFHFEPEAVVEPVHAVAPMPEGRSRAVLARIADRWVAHPLRGGSALQEGFASADAVLTASDDRVSARLLVPADQLERSALMMGCDPGLRLLVEHLALRAGSAGRLLWLSASSRAALDALAEGEAHLAGSHLRDDDGGFNVGYARAALGDTGGLVVTLAAWEEGLVVAAGNPKGIRGASDLARPDVLLVNREPGAGSRRLLDDLLREEGIAAAEIRGFEVQASGHLAVARAVSSGTADVGPALRAAAEVYGLDFIPVTKVRFDLVVPRPSMEHPVVSALLDALQTRAFREEIAALPGYEVSETGRVAAEIPSAA